MLTALKKLYRATVTVDAEREVVIDFIARSAPSPSQVTVLDVGCGYGRYLRDLNKRGFAATGIEVNAEIVARNRADGLDCVRPEELPRELLFDVILMSHVVEHFAPAPLLDFMDSYLDRLKIGGRLVIATPLHSSNFYDDFDHVRPYQPIGLLMVFGADAAQVQYYARNRLALRDVWFRRSPWRGSYRRARYINGASSRVLQVFEFAAAIGFRLSGGLLGRADGWVGCFEKIR